MHKLLLMMLVAIGLFACDKVPDKVAGVDLKQVGELGVNLLESNIKAQCENAFSEVEESDESGSKKRKLFRLIKTGGGGDDGENGGLLDMVFTAEQKQMACDCVIKHTKDNLSAQQLQKIANNPKEIGNFASNTINVCVAQMNSKLKQS